MQEKIKVTNTDVTTGNSYPINLRCPDCHRLSTLDRFKKIHDGYIVTKEQRVIFGHRICPNADCKLLIYVLYKTEHENGEDKITIVKSVPQERLDFDATDIPKSIVNSLEEAITCHASGCYIAGAIMVRKTIEELCTDKGAKGKNLFEQIRDLSNHVIVPQYLLKGIDNLRLLGNDAAM